MSNGAKKIIMILAALFLVSAGVAFFALSQKAVLEQSKAELEDQVKDYKDKTEKLGPLLYFSNHHARRSGY